MTRFILLSAAIFAFALHVPARAATNAVSPPGVAVNAGAPVYIGSDWNGNSCCESRNSYARGLWDDFCHSRRRPHIARPCPPPPLCGPCCELPKLRLPKWTWPKWSLSSCSECQTLHAPCERSCTGFKLPQWRLPKISMPQWGWKSKCAAACHRLDVFGVFRRSGSCCDAEHYYDANGEDRIMESTDTLPAPAATDDGPAIAPPADDELPLPPAEEEARRWFMLHAV